MTTTPRLRKSQTQVNTSDAPFPGRGGSNFQGDGQIAPLQDGGYVVVWEDDSNTYNPDGPAIVGQRYDPAGNRAGGEVNISQFTGGTSSRPRSRSCPTVTLRSRLSISSMATKISTCAFSIPR